MAGGNFGFLESHDASLVKLGVLAERYFRDDPSTSIFKLRQLAELLANQIAARQGIYRGEREPFEETLRRLSYDRAIPRETADLFHALRKSGSTAAHEFRGSHSDALTALKLARQLGVWFHRTYGKDPSFEPGAFVPPEEPPDATAAMREEIASFRQRIAESEDAIVAARLASEEQARARESVEERLKRETEEREVWEKLAAEVEAEKGAIAARLSELQSTATKTAQKVLAQLAERGEKAATQFDLDEASTRTLIDQQLRDRGWEVDTKSIRYGSGSRPGKGRNLAIAEWPTTRGPADYALFIGTTLVGVVEAKRKRKNV